MTQPTSNQLTLSTVEAARGPIEEAAEDVLTLFFLLLVQKDQAILGRTSKRFHAIYLAISPIARGVHELHSNLLAVELVNAAKARALIASEAHAVGVSYEYTPDAKNKELYSQALQKFFTNFHQQFSELQIEPDLVIYPTLALSAQNIIRSTFKELTTDATQLIKIAKAIYDFDQMVFMKICETYGSQPIPAITNEFYKTILPIGLGCSRIYSNLKDLGTELINKTLSRKLTNDERDFLGLGENEFKSSEELLDHLAKVQNATLGLQNFHAKFQEILAGFKDSAFDEN